MSHIKLQSGEPFSFPTAIEYSQNSIVSSIVIKKLSGQITLFAFDTGEELSEHTSPFDALVQIIDGSAEILISGNSHVVHTGQSIILPGNIPHALKAIERFKMVLTMIK